MKTASLQSNSAMYAVFAAFLVNGVGVGAIGALLPTFGNRWGSDSRGLGLFLVIVGLSAIVGINVGGRVSDRVGARGPVLIGLVVMAVGTLLISASSSLAMAATVGVIYGFGNGLTDVSMNAMGVQVEQARPRPLMSRFHASFSAGSLLGALIVLVAGRASSATTTIVATLVLVAALLLAGDLVVLRASAQTTPVHAHAASGPIPRAAWILGVMAICFAITEGSAMDWSSVHVTDVAHVSTATGAWGLACVSAFMLTVRAAGDAIVHRIGRRAVVRWGAALAVVGYLIGVLASALPIVLFGWCVVGAGVALVAPQIYGMAGLAGGGRTLSVVVTMGYAAFLIGPGLIGVLVHRYGVQRALIVPLVLGVCLSALAAVMPTEKTLAAGTWDDGHHE